MTAVRRAALVLSASFAFAACGASGDRDDGADGTGRPASAATLDGSPAEAPTGSAPSSPPRPGEPFEVEQLPASPAEDVVSGLEAGLAGSLSDGLPEPTVPLDQLRSGGPPPDGIPPIDEPRFLRPDQVDFLADNEPVLAFDVDGDARAYPVQILIWHEIVNDTVGGEPVAVTYCPLCNSALAYDRRVGERVLTFGTSGMLYNSALVMWDRQTETLWSHFTGEAIVGELTGTELESRAVSTVAWGEWRDAHPDGLVLSRDTGHNRSYGDNPYPGYDAIDGTPFLFEGEVDGRYTAMTRIVGVERDGAAVGVPLESLQESGVVTAELGGEPITVWWTGGTASALDSPSIAEGVDVGSTAVFSPVVDGRPLTFTADGNRFVDAETGSTWNLFGEAVDGDLAGTQLDPVVHVDTFWFAWSTFRPDTVVVG